LIHYAAPQFWACYRSLPVTVQKAADKSFVLLKTDSRHASLHFKKLGNYWSVRASLQYRALGVDVPGGVLWFWIGTHAEYERLIA